VPQEKAQKEDGMMANKKIKGGYILLSRKIIESEIWGKPPLYLKVWIYLLCRAQHQQYKNLDRGYLFFKISDIIRDCQWKIGYRTVKPTKDQIFQILDWMRNTSTRATMKATMNATMITTTKATHGMFAKVENYSFYQDPKNYESNDESNDASNNERSTNPDNINKNDNKNDKNDIYNIVFDHWNSKNIIVHKKLTDEFKKDIDKVLKESTQEEILKTMNHYAEAYHDPSYEYCSYKWGIHEFLTRKEGYKRFLDDGSKWLNYLKHKNKKEGQNGSNTENNKQDYDYSKLYYQPKSGCHDDIPEDI
jgi:ABC-type antimicrobial peptide transport system permease subunit